MKNISPRCTSECKLLDAYKKQGLTNHVGALRAIPRSMRTMYVHAYQSFLWNHAASLRFEAYGADKVVAGDLVLPPNSSTGSDDWLTSSDRIQAVRVVTGNDIEMSQYSIEDVVLPIPGSGTIYPENAVNKKTYESLALADGVSLKSSSHNVADFSLDKLKGDYRKVFQKVAELEFQVVSAFSHDDKINETDLEKLRAMNTPGSYWPEAAQKRKNPMLSDEKAAESVKLKKTSEGNRIKPMADYHMDPEPEDHASARCSPADGMEYMHLWLKFRLPPSSYATMLTRELMKSTSAKKHHMAKSKSLDAYSQGIHTSRASIQA